MDLLGQHTSRLVFEYSQWNVNGSAGQHTSRLVFEYSLWNVIGSAGQDTSRLDSHMKNIYF